MSGIIKKEVNKVAITNKSSTIIIGLVIGLAIGFVLGFSLNKQSSEPNEELLMQLEEAKKFFPTIPDMFSVSGIVKEIKGDTITLDTFQSPNPFEDIPLSREIIVTQATEIIKQENKDPEDYQKEFEVFNEKIAEQTGSLTPEPLIPPNPFVEKSIDISEIKVNDQITVDAGKNIKTLKSFEAVRIVIQPSFGLAPVGTVVVPAPGDVIGQAVPLPAPAPGSVPEQAVPPPGDVIGQAVPLPAPAPCSVPEQAVPPPAP